MKKKHTIVMCLLFFLVMHIAERAKAQDAIFSQFYTSSLYLNPAFAGTNYGSRLVMNYRNHPFTDLQGFSTLFSSYDVFVPGIYGGIGVMVVSDNQGGLLTSNQLSTIYAYHMQINHDLFLNFGTQVTYLMKDIRWDRLTFINPNQPPPDATGFQTLTFSTGVMLINDRVFGGLAVHNLNQPRIELVGDSKLDMKYTAHLGFNIEPTKNRRINTYRYEYSISPNLVIQKQGIYERINVGFFTGVENFLMGLWYRYNLSEDNTMIFLFGLIVRDIRFGYSYDYSFSGYSDAFHAAHEISLTFEFGSGRKKPGQNRMHCPCL